MFDPRNNLANEVSAQLIMHFGDKVFRTIIPRNVRLAEAPSFGKPVLLHDKESRGALAYLALAGEMIRREEEELRRARRTLSSTEKQHRMQADRSVIRIRALSRREAAGRAGSCLRQPLIGIKPVRAAAPRIFRDIELSMIAK